jgi:hypothetical protein
MDPNAPEPTQEDWIAFLDETATSISSGDIAIPPGTRDIMARLNLARAEDVSAKRYFAASRLMHYAEQVATNHNAYLQDYATQRGISLAEAATEFQTKYEDAARDLRAKATKDWVEEWSTARGMDQSLLADRCSLFAYAQLEATRRYIPTHNESDALIIVANAPILPRPRTRTQRRTGESREIPLTTPTPILQSTSISGGMHLPSSRPSVDQRFARHSVFSSFINEIGYDPDTQTLEVIMKNQAEAYIYRNVSIEEYDEFDQYVPIGRYFSQHIRGREFTRMPISQSVSERQFPYRCNRCGQFANFSHICDAQVKADYEEDLTLRGIPLSPIEAPKFTARTTARGWMQNNGHFALQIPNRHNIMEMANDAGVVALPVFATISAFRLDHQPNDGVVGGHVNVFYRDSQPELPYEVVSPLYEDDSMGLRCTCTSYTANPHECTHINSTIAYITSVLHREESEYQAENLRKLADLTDDELAQEYEISIVASNKAITEWRSLSVSFEENPAALKEIMDEISLHNKKCRDLSPSIARKMNTDKYPIPYIRENAFGGLATRVSGRGFGAEIEFSFPETFSFEQKGKALGKIGQDLYDAGLTMHSHQSQYHASHGRYRTKHEKGWAFERDSTVSGEIISPVMYDEPQTWENLEKVCKILKDNGAIADTSAGAHVHVGVANYDHRVENHNRLLQLFTENKDLIYRMSTNPERGTHRGRFYCEPNLLPSSPYESITSARDGQLGHYKALNLENLTGQTRDVTGRVLDHIEFRTFDASLQPGVIQAQIGMAVYMAEGGLRPKAMPQELWSEDLRRDPSSHIEPEEATTDEEWRNATAGLRSFIDRLVPGSDSIGEKDNPRVRQLAALFLNTRWQDN